MPKACRDRDETLLHRAADVGFIPLIARLCPGLVTPAAFTELRDQDGLTPLHRAAAAGTLGQVLEACPGLGPEAFDVRDD